MRAASIVAKIALASTAALALACPVSAQTDKPPARPGAAAAPAAQTPLPTLSRVVPQRDRDAVLAYYRAEIAAGRCPPPLARKEKACVAPASSKPAWKVDQPLADGVTVDPPPPALIGKLSPSPAGFQYLRVGNDILMVGIGTRIVAAVVADLSRL